MKKGIYTVNVQTNKLELELELELGLKWLNFPFYNFESDFSLLLKPSAILLFWISFLIFNQLKRVSIGGPQVVSTLHLYIILALLKTAITVLKSVFVHRVILHLKTKILTLP